MREREREREREKEIKRGSLRHSNIKCYFLFGSSFFHVTQDRRQKNAEKTRVPKYKKENTKQDNNNNSGKMNRTRHVQSHQYPKSFHNFWLTGFFSVIFNSNLCRTG